MKLYLDPGHGGYDPGASGHGLKEKDIVLDIALRIRDILQAEYQNVDVKMSRTKDHFIGLEERTDEANAWEADYFLSVHCNSFNGSAHGYEDYIHDSLPDSSTTAKYRDIMHHEIMAVNQLSNRGKKKANFHVLRESKMSALLTENGFIDNSHDAALMAESSWRQTVARGHVNGLQEAFHLKRKHKSNGKLYRVIAGSFKKKQNAKDRASYLHSKGIDAFVDPTQINGKPWYRVQAGAFKSHENAERQLAKVKKVGIEDAFIVSDAVKTDDED